MFVAMAWAAAVATPPARPPTQAAIAAPPAPLDAAAARATGLRAATLLEERYVFPAVGRRYGAALRVHATRGDYAAITDPAELAKRLTDDLQAVQPDGHVRVYRIAPPPAQQQAQPPAADPAASTDPHRLGFRDMKWIAPGIAFLSFEHFDDRPAALAILMRFFADYGDARALVIDSRDNHGGGFDMLGIIANHLFGRSRHLADMDMASAVVAAEGAPFPIDGKVLRQTAGPAGQTRFEHWAVPDAHEKHWFAKPVYYLTSRRSFSAAEHLAMVLKSTGRATLIGEATGGGNHFGGTEPIGSGLELFVPVGRTSDPRTGRDWEGTGVAPEVAVPADQALAEALRRIGASPAAPKPRRRSAAEPPLAAPGDLTEISVR